MRKILTMLVLVVGAAALLTAPAGAEGLAWGPCPFPGRVECATVQVPVDYRDPGGERIDIHVSRVRSERPDLRRGTLIMNQGGPGPHPRDAASIHELVPRSVLDAYDIISFDQRGFGVSAPVHCGLTPEEQFTFPWPLPGGEPAVRQRARRIADKCASQELMPFLGTANVARDMAASVPRSANARSPTSGSPTAPTSGGLRLAVPAPRRPDAAGQQHQPRHGVAEHLPRQHDHRRRDAFRRLRRVSRAGASGGAA